MSYNKGKISEGQLAQIFSIEENHFNDFKSKDISGRQFSKIVSALANASGGDVYNRSIQSSPHATFRP